MTLNSTTPIADLHTPEELLDNAETLFAYNNPKMMRAAVLEAITALESYVQAVVFSSLSEKLDPLLVQWLEDKTKMDFDSRLSVLTPVAVGQPIDKQSALWTEYKRAKEIRNKVTHSGRKVSSTDARFVIDTVYKWLAYLGSTVELELALIRFKQYIEENSIKITSEREAISIINDYFGKPKVAVSTQEVQKLKKIPSRNLRVDIILKSGFYTTIVETYFFSKDVLTHLSITSIVEHIKQGLTIFDITQGVAIIFQQGDSREANQSVIKYPVSISEDRQRMVYTLVIRV